MKRRNLYITAEDEKEIVRAIQMAEHKTSGEIRVHIESNSQGEKLEHHAQKIFFKLKMQETKLRNGVLIYLAIDDRRFYILGDKGIHDKVPDDFWENTKTVMQKHFKNADFKGGLISGILMVGTQLKQLFPGLDNDTNELPDEISRG